MRVNVCVICLQEEEYGGYDYGETDYSVEIPDWNTFTQIQFTTLPAKLSMPTVGSKTQNTISVSWQPYVAIADSAKFLHYEICLESSTMSKVTRTTTDTRMVVGGLTPAETYTIKVRTVTTEGTSPYSDAAQAVTDDLTISKVEQWRESLGVNALQVPIHA